MKEYKIALIPGDGVGPEIIAEGRKVVESAGERYGFKVQWVYYPFGADRYLKTGEILPDSALKEMEKVDAIYLGAVGDPRVKPGILERGILLKLRFYFDQYVNLRPIKLFSGVETPLKGKRPEDIDFYVVRENTEDFYIGLGARVSGEKELRQELDIDRRLYKGKFRIELELKPEQEVAYQIGMISRKGAERVIKYAFELAKSRGKNKVTSVDKANAIPQIYSLWRDVFNEVAKNYPDISTEFNYVDATTMWMVKKPEDFQVIVVPNMFGDIITDLGAMIQGGLGIAAGGNINPEGISMFEPIHGSAPKYKGKGVINPLATILAGGMMLDFLGEKESAEAVNKAVEKVLKEGRVKTKDLGGGATTSEMGDAVAEAVKEV
ncbi:MAG: isocitrate/isopropylmalate dehydrogenase family protein [Synergistetes bacterium]|nr:isocitrate/isopropylmalate dehydrogenase family protein [Synergistota bacterium]